MNIWMGQQRSVTYVLRNKDRRKSGDWWPVGPLSGEFQFLLEILLNKIEGRLVVKGICHPVDNLSTNHNTCMPTLTYVYK